jgi:hypothetical protein
VCAGSPGHEHIVMERHRLGPQTARSSSVHGDTRQTGKTLAQPPKTPWGHANIARQQQLFAVPPHGKAWRGLDRRRRMGEGRASGVSGRQGIGTVRWGKPVLLSRIPSWQVRGFRPHDGEIGPAPQSTYRYLLALVRLRWEVLRQPLVEYLCHRERAVYG